MCKFCKSEIVPMGFNIDIIFDNIGRIKLATVIVGLIDMILIVSSYYSHDSRDEAFLGSVIFCFLLSLSWVLGVMSEYLVVTDSLIRIDMVFHAVACLLLLATDTCFLTSILKYGKGEHFGERILAMILGYVNSAIYGYLPWTLLKST